MNQFSVKTMFRLLSENNPVPEMHVARMQWLYDNREIVPTPLQYAQFTDLLMEVTELAVSPEQGKQVLDLYPFNRIELACGDIGDTDVKGEVLNAISFFFLGCPWPTYGDNISEDVFLQELRKRAALFKL